MTSFSWRRYVAGSPQQIIAHADYRRSRGKKPSMAYEEIANPQLALKLARAILKRDSDASRQYAEYVRGVAEEMEKKWRDDFNDDRQPTVSTIVPCSKDMVDVSEDCFYSLHIVHVKDFHGNGFMPQICYSFNITDGTGHHYGNGDVFNGVDATAYDKAIEAGRKWLQNVLEERDKELKRY